MCQIADTHQEYRAIGVSLPKPGQPESRNADCFGSASRLDGGHSLLGVVCDGVSACKHGKHAAQLTCQTVVSSFECEWTGSAEPVSWLAAALLAAHRRVCKEHPRDSALCTVVSALVVPAERQFVVANAGDSAAYQFRSGNITKLTADHCTTVPVRINGRVVLHDGVPTMARTLTMAVGQNKDFRPEMAVHEYEEGDLLCLASDGVSESGLVRFLREAGQVLDATAVGRFCAEMREKSGDDTTLLIFRLGSTEAWRKLARHLADYGRLDASRRDSLLAEVEQAGAMDVPTLATCLRLEGNEDRALRIVELMSHIPACLTRDEWIGCLDTAVERKQRRLATRLVAVIRRR